MVLHIALPMLLLQAPVITELASNPLDETTGEFVEIFNPSDSVLCISGFSITDGDALDELVPWDESLHGTFPHSGMLLGTDSIPSEGFALVFELDYLLDPVYQIPAGTVILTTGDHSVCNGLAASSDPLTLFDGSGTADSNVVSTYGTPVETDIWQDRDDDGLDGIPFEPEDGCTVERYPWSSPDMEGSWLQGPPGGTPGMHAQAPPDTLNISCDSIWTVPEEPLPGQSMQISASFTCWGNTAPSSGSVVIFLDSQGDSTASPDEVLEEFPATSMTPGSTFTFTATAVLEQGWFLPSAIALVDDDHYPEDDHRCISLPVGGGIPAVITEVLCNPLNEDRGEYLEIFYGGPGLFPLCGCSFTDGDALDVICRWDLDDLNDPDALYGQYLPSGEYGIVIDPEYAEGVQEYDLAATTYVFTVENTTIGNGLTGTDPITLYDPFGTAQMNVLSTYGTPLANNDPLLCDDDGLDGIPFDPGEYHSVERKSSDLPDEEYCWTVSPEGGTPGGPAVFVDTLDAAVDSILVSPGEPQPGQPLQLEALISNRGTASAYGLEVTIFLDSNADTLPQADEILCTDTVDSLYPGMKDTVTVIVNCPEDGYYLAAAVVHLAGDAVPGNDFSLRSFKSGEGVPLVISEVLCNPGSEDTDEFIEIYYPGPGVFTVTGCTFTDGDALDIIVPWDGQIGALQDPDAVFSVYLLPDSYGLILDREYAQGDQVWDLAVGTRVYTTGNTTLGDGLSCNDPVTLYSPQGTESANVMSTYGTPVDSDDPLLRDDDGSDGIPFDPGQDNSVHRRVLGEPDTETNWFASPLGPTPGAPPPFFVQGVNCSGILMDCSPPMGPGDEPVDILAAFANSGTDTIGSGEMTAVFYADADHNGSASPDEAFDSYVCGQLAPGDTSWASCQWNSHPAETAIMAIAVCPDDSIASDDTLSFVWNRSDREMVINEIMYSPSPGNPEWIELFNRSQNTVDLAEWTLEDSRDRHAIILQNLPVESGCYVILTSDSSNFRDIWGTVPCQVIQPVDWPVLNNTTQEGEDWADEVEIRDSCSVVVDYVPYDDDWGGGTGISLEKIHPDSCSYLPSSWSSCGTEGTPGQQNSCYAGGSGGSGGFLSVYPDPFSPDGDGIDDVLTIEMNFLHPENQVTLEIYNVQGRLLLRILDREDCGASRTVTWNGRGEGGSRLPVGRYIVFLSSRSPDTGETREACTVVVLARRL